MSAKPRKVRVRKKVDGSELTRRVGRLVDALRKKPEQHVTLSDVAGVTEILIASLDRYMGSIDTSLYRECQELSAHIAQTRAEIAQLSDQDITKTRIPRAGQELDAIVKATEEATSEIMSAAEEMMAADGADGAALKTIVEAGCMRIFEACAFQDITGQRIAKVVNTLSFIEERLAGLQKIMVHSDGNGVAEGSLAPVEGAPIEDERAGDERLLNGPALAGEGINQSDVDALMNGMGKPAAPKAPAHAGEGVSQSDVDALMNGIAKPAAASAATPRVVDVLAPDTGKDSEPLPSEIEAKIDALFR